MTTVFKHLKRQHALMLLEGHIRIGSFGYYQNSEAPISIQDPLEGRTEGFVTNTTLTTTAEEPETTTIAGLQFSVATGGTISMSGVKFVRELPPAYIYCTSSIDERGLFKDKDSVIRINDIEEFGRIIVNARRDIFNGYVADFVRYESRTYNAVNHCGLDPHPLVKHHDPFAREQEYRIVFLPTGAVQPFIDLHIPLLKQAGHSGLFEEIKQKS